MAALAKDLFLAASDLADPAERAAFLDRECGDNGELRARVEALLRANDCPGMVMHLSSLPGLTPEEQNDLKLAATDLREMHRFIRDNRPTGGAGDPRKDDLNKISTLTDLLDRIGGRLRAEPLEVPYAEGNQPGT